MAYGGSTTALHALHRSSQLLPALITQRVSGTVICTALHSSAQLCTALHSSAQLCTALRSSALSAQLRSAGTAQLGMYSTAQLSTAQPAQLSTRPALRHGFARLWSALSTHRHCRLCAALRLCGSADLCVTL
jgi:hypothetical protein